MTHVEARNFCENELQILANLVEIDSEEENNTVIFIEIICRGFRGYSVQPVSDITFLGHRSFCATVSDVTFFGQRSFGATRE